MDSKTLIDRGFENLCRGDYASAIPALQEAVQLVPEDYEANLYLGRALTFCDRFEDARPCLNRAAELCPKRSTPWHYLAELDERQGHLQAALDESQRGLELNPEDRACQLVSGRLLARAGRVQEAIAELEMLLRARGNIYLGTLEALAPLYLAAGRRAHALELDHMLQAMRG